MNSAHSYISSQILNSDYVTGENRACEPRIPGENEFYHSPYSDSGKGGIGFEALQSFDAQHEKTDVPRAIDTSETPETQEIESTPSKTSGKSSHTSAGLRSIKNEVDDLETSIITLQPPSPSTVSSRLSPAKSMTPLTVAPNIKVVKKITQEVTQSSKITFY